LGSVVSLSLCLGLNELASEQLQLGLVPSEEATAPKTAVPDKASERNIDLLITDQPMPA
jgi:hypothetical protein